MEMNWSAIGTGVTIAGAVIGTIFAVGAFYGASTKSNAELEKRMDLLEELIEDRTEKIQDELTELRIDFARAGFPEDPSRRGHSKVTHGGG